MRRLLRACGLVVAIAVVVWAGEAAAGDWEIEVHGGGLLTSVPSSGRVTKPPHAQPFQSVVPGVLSLRVTSWYFGDGGSVLEWEQPETYVSPWGETRQYLATVRPLDSVLSSAAIEWPFRGAGGFRLGRRLGRRLSAELSIDLAGHAPTFSGPARSRIEDARRSFAGSWSSTLSSLPASHVSSQATVLGGSGHQLVVTGAINVNLRASDPPKWSRRPSRRRFVTYLTLGAGVVSSGGKEASATLVGRYRFESPAGEAPFEETDTVTVRSSTTFGTSLIGLVGLGWKKDLSTRWGMRCDARAYFGRNPTHLVLDARPSVTTGSPASALVVSSASVGTIQFVNDSSGVRGGQQSSLSGPPLTGFETFKGTGTLWQISFSLGVFLRL